MEHYKVGINVSKLDKTAFSTANNGDIWMNVTLWRNKDGEDQYGQIGLAKQDLGKDRQAEQRDTPIIGNFKAFSTSQNQVSRPAQQEAEPSTTDDDSDIPF